MYRVRLLSALIASGGLVGSSLPAAAIISGSGYHLGPGGFYYPGRPMMPHPMPKPPMPKPPMPKPPHMGGGCCGGGHAGGWGGGHGGSWGGGHGGSWGHAGGWGNGGGWGHGGSGGGHWGGGYPKGGNHTAWHRPPLGMHPMGMHMYGMGGGSHGYGMGGMSSRRPFSGGGSLYARYSAANARLIARFGGGDLEGHYGAGYGAPPSSWKPAPPSAPKPSYPPRTWGGYGGYKPGGSTAGNWHHGPEHHGFGTRVSYKYFYSYKVVRKRGGAGSWEPPPPSNGSWGPHDSYGMK